MSDISTAGSKSSQFLLKAVVIGLGALIVIALGFVVTGMVSKFAARPPATAAAPGSFALPRGAKIVDIRSEPNRLILHLRTEAGEEVDIVDTTDGHLVARIK